MQQEPPKVFVSHAGEDKERFVLGFAERLYSKGIEAWVDRWKMLPGDSLVQKIFEEGIKNAQAMIVVISEYSIDKRWVQAELNAGVVNHIEQASRLIPVVIGNQGLGRRFSRMRRFLMGSTSEKVSRYARCSVMVVRMDLYERPPA